jgi:hypothetical protein
VSLVKAGLHIVGKFFNEHQRPHLLHRLRGVVLNVQQLLAFL